MMEGGAFSAFADSGSPLEPGLLLDKNLAGDGLNDET